MHTPFVQSIGSLPAAAALVAALVLVGSPSVSAAAPEALAVSGFAFTLEVSVPGSPDAAFTAFTERTIEWWDHSFSENPKKMYFDTVPGGGFWEIFDDAGSGARHAEVIYVEKGKVLRFVGPLGLSGSALDMVHTLTFAADGDRTKVSLSLRAFGEMREEWPAIVEATWSHFLVERFQPYMEGTLD